MAGHRSIECTWLEEGYKIEPGLLLVYLWSQKGKLVWAELDPTPIFKRIGSDQRQVGVLALHEKVHGHGLSIKIQQWY